MKNQNTGNNNKLIDIEFAFDGINHNERQEHLWYRLGSGYYEPVPDPVQAPCCNSEFGKRYGILGLCETCARIENDKRRKD
jgi:hypothetical protein